MAQDDFLYCRTATIQQGVTISSGGQTISAGGLSVTGGVVADNQSGGVTPLVAIATAGTVAIPTKTVRLSVSGGATASSLVLPNGTKDGQELNIINENATGASTLIFPSAANLPTAVTVSGANVGKKLVWVSATSIWSPL